MPFTDPCRTSSSRAAGAADRGMVMVDFASARRMMVDGQIRTNDVTNPFLLGAFQQVPRERFVPPDSVDLAYLDLDLPVLPAAPGQRRRCLLKPMVLAKLIELADVSAADHVLDVGCATGYSTAILAHLAADVVAVEEDAELAKAAAQNLRASGLQNASVRASPLPEGYPPDAPFDVIVVNGAVEVFPRALGSQLADGGRMVCVLRRGPAGKGMLYRSSGGDVSGRPMFEAAAPLLPGFEQPHAFVF